MTASLVRLRDGWDRFWFAPQSTAPVEVLRIAFGVVTTVWMLSLVPVLDPFFGRDGAIPVRELPVGGWTLFSLVQGSPLIWVLWLAGVLGAVALTVGFRTRVAALVVFVVIMSVTRSAPLAFNAGDGLLRLVAFYVLLMPAGSAASVDRWRADPEHLWSFPRRAPWALRLAQIQLSVIYVSTVWEKAGGARWRDGTAVSYAVRIGEVSRVPVPSFVTGSPLLAELATYGTLAAELAIGVLVWNRAARPWVLALGVLLHLSIEITLAVGFFSLTIVTLYLAFLPPDRAEQVLRWVRDRVGCRGRRRPTRTPASEEGPEPEDRPTPAARECVDAESQPVAEAAQGIGVSAEGRAEPQSDGEPNGLPGSGPNAFITVLPASNNERVMVDTDNVDGAAVSAGNGPARAGNGERT
ncbi:HTTM domain-containing protein [Actinomycetospora cinnamomea]|uniref:Vitamin K-dependent gamma-carboxylase-like protein n=1 Tax=Actinomycetospora cinnamomea TaxID=663609 RepID=A0A2U1FME6_9PSEU|nr:HTTM domain-containing protein [Actinomycetospora cinnamomea]PVZ13272.1 vitamin K-dependent gamma-carboxylase-like protein [Actinomycetospora cinnamomea]